MTMTGFSGIVGNDTAKLALRCALCSDSIRSVLICGPRGTGKSALASSVGGISGGREVVRLPLGATEDRIFGGLDIEDTIGTGRSRGGTSILRRSHGNILLVENANLLQPHVLHHILDVTENRVNVVEREGISEVHPCDHTLVATMDPSEGALPDNILDRFDLCAFTHTLGDEDSRVEALVSNLRGTDVTGEDDGLCRTIADARGRCRFVHIPEGYYRAVTETCRDLGVMGHRGDVAVMNAARAVAALKGHATVDLEDLRDAVSVSLEHRRNDLDDMRREEPEPRDPPERSDEQPEDDRPRDDGNGSETDPGRTDDGGDLPDTDVPPPPPGGPPSGEEVFSIGDRLSLIDYLSLADDGYRHGRSGRHAPVESEDPSGRCVGYRMPRGRPRDIALVPSIRMAAPYQPYRVHDGLALVLERGDLREKVRTRRSGKDVLFLVDGSGSLGAQKRMVAVKGAVLSILEDAYRRRDRIGMAVFRKDSAEEVLPLTKSTATAYRALQAIPTGGRTPLTRGLMCGHGILSSRGSTDAEPVMVILSDGRCNVSVDPGRRPLEEMLSTASALSSTETRFIVVDTETGRNGLGLALDLCNALGGTYLRLEELDADRLTRSVRGVIWE
ncbi:MAG: VWA domain-containing protein [Candidatus Methanomethylophilaceae archaeon]|nr:VWA domain-containing protein [Candidatus Methanomethylophilaceae archaeon]